MHNKTNIKKSQIEIKRIETDKIITVTLALLVLSTFGNPTLVQLSLQKDFFPTV